MEKLPEDLHVDILRRLDSADVACCRVASKIFNDAYPHLRSIKLHWTIVKPSSENLFRKTFVDLISNMRVVESVCIGVDELREYNTNLDDMFYNLVTNKHFIKEWLPKVSENLKSLSLTDFLEPPSILWWKSNVLKLVSIHCHKLVELKVKHTRLSVNSLSPMLMLTTLTLESLHLYDEHITVLNMCAPNLQVLNLVSVYGLADPKIHLLNLISSQLITSPIRLKSLSLIARKLIRLRLKGIRASKLHVEAPILSHFHIDHFFCWVNQYYVEDAFSLKKFENLKHLLIKYGCIGSTLYDMTTPIKTVEHLTVDSQGVSSGVMSTCKFTLEKLFTVFPNVISLCIKSFAWWELEDGVIPEFSSKITDGTKRLKTLCAYLIVADHPSFSLNCVACVLGQCIGLSEVSLLIHDDVDADILKTFIADCVARWPRIKWRWGMWSEGMENCSPCDLFQGFVKDSTTYI